jgi:hypothetical protein
VSDVSEESAEALSEPVSDVASDEFDSEFAVTSSIDAASVEESTSVEAVPHPIRASIIVVANIIAVVVFFFIGLSFLYSN